MEACGEEHVVAEGRSDSSASSASTSSTTSSNSASAAAAAAGESSAESPRTPDGVGAESFPLCPNCRLRHPGGKSKDSFCTEGKQGALETLVAMGTLGLVSRPV